MRRKFFERQIALAWVAVALVAAVPRQVMAADMISASAPKSRACSWTSPGGDFRAFTCALQATGTTQRFRFKAYFSGGHDDTMASLTATLNGDPFTCEAGSKTRLMGEEGDVGLDCRISLRREAGTRHVLGIALLWSHAQYTDVELVSE